jgi:hypothetical protein
MDALTGPERVEVIRHYMGSAKKALAPHKRFPIGENGLCTICCSEVCEHTSEREADDS